MGYIYLICDPDKDHYKIGVTREKDSKRIKKLQTGNSCELHIVHIYECEYPFRLETMLHNYYKDKCVLNEWFELSEDEVIYFLNKCKEFDSIINELKCNPFFNKNLK